MAANPPPVPLQTSNNANIPTRKTVEETYQKRSQHEHILLRPDTYIGSIVKNRQNLWIYDETIKSMINRPVTYVPGLYKIFDEILVNAGDNKQRDPSMDLVSVEIDVENGRISVFNNGEGIPVVVHKKERIYVPEMIFGHLLTSSNYDDGVKKTTGGSNGFGAKLTNIFSTEFVVETADAKRQKKYKQVFTNNMNKTSKPIITPCKTGESWTKVSFKPDLAKFNMSHLEEDVVALMKKRVVDLAGCLGETVKVELNGQQVPVNSFLDYVNLYVQPADSTQPSMPRFSTKSDSWEICVCVREARYEQVSFVNGIATIKGGTHVDYITYQIVDHVIKKVLVSKPKADIKDNDVKNHLWVFVKALIHNPSFNSQTKMSLTTCKDDFGSFCDLSEEFLNKISEAGIVESLVSYVDYRLKREQKKADQNKRKRIPGIPKLEDANEAGGRDSDKCTLILTEGDSAKALAMAGISTVGRNHYGVFPLKGKMLNVREATDYQIRDNTEIQNIMQILGLERGKQYESVEPLRYGHLC